MADKLASAIMTLREQRAWTQEDLAASSGVSVRQIRRLEGGEIRLPKKDTIAKLAAALETDAARLLHGRTADEITQLIAENSCDFCGAGLSQRVSIPHEYGDDELDVFECGATRGFRVRPCGGDPRFPAFDDFELTYSNEDGLWYCWARGRTPWSQSVDLQNGFGDTEAKARNVVERSYLIAKFGFDEAERLIPFADLG